MPRRGRPGRACTPWHHARAGWQIEISRPVRRSVTSIPFGRPASSLRFRCTTPPMRSPANSMVLAKVGQQSVDVVLGPIENCGKVIRVDVVKVRGHGTSHGRFIRNLRAIRSGNRRAEIRDEGTLTRRFRESLGWSCIAAVGQVRSGYQRDTLDLCVDGHGLVKSEQIPRSQRDPCQ